MLQTFGVAKGGLVPDYIYDLAFNEWYMVYGGIVLVLNTLQRYLWPAYLISFLNQLIFPPAYST